MSYASVEDLDPFAALPAKTISTDIKTWERAADTDVTAGSPSEGEVAARIQILLGATIRAGHRSERLARYRSRDAMPHGTTALIAPIYPKENYVLFEPKQVMKWAIEAIGIASRNFNVEPLSGHRYISFSELADQFSDLAHTENLSLSMASLAASIQRTLPEASELYDTEDHALIIESLWGSNRVACVIRDKYAHIMALIGEKMYDETLSGPDFSEHRAVRLLNQIIQGQDADVVSE